MNLRHINLRAHPCYRDPDPINLYHKVGHGTLDMYVLSPSKDSREVREFLAKWHASDSKLFAGSHRKDSNNLTFPIQNLVSICALLVWQPANPEDTITRILFPGSTPQHKIFEGFDRLKHLEFLKHPVCSAKTLSPSTSLATLRDKPTKPKLSLIEKEPKKISEPKKDRREPSEPKSIKAADEAIPKTTPQSMPIIPMSKPKAEMKTKKVAENKKIETEAKESKKIETDAKESKKIEKELKEVKKEPKKDPAKEKTEKSEKREDDVKKTDSIKPELEKTALKEPKEPKSKPEPRKKEAREIKIKAVKSEVPSKPKPSEKKVKPLGMEKKDVMKSSPTTPKKTLNGTATKTEVSKTVPKAKPVPKVAPSLPAKSAKEANNRKVVEQKNIEKSAAKDAAASVVKVSAKPKPMDRKPISRRAKPVSPSKARLPGSPAKSTRSTPTTSVKSDKDGVIRKVKGDKGTTDSSTVSTPSGIEPEAVKPIDKSLIEQSEDISLDSIESKVLADLKEEREVVEEIEAVLQKAERIEETRKDDRFEGDDEITAEATDKKEEDVTEEDVTAEIEDAPKKEGSRKESQELTEEDEYLIVEKEEVYTEDSAQSGEGEQKHVLDEAESEKAKVLKDMEAMKEKDEKEEVEEKGKDETPEKKVEKAEEKDKKEIADLSPKHKEQLQEEVKEIIASAAEIVQKTEEKDDSGKKDSEDITKEPSSLSPDKLDSSEKKTTDTDMKPDVDQKEHIIEKMEESQERISTVESGATTTAPTLPEDERIPLDEIKEDIDEKHVIEEVKEKDAPTKLREEVVPEATVAAVKPEVKVFDVRQVMQNLQRDIVKTPDEVADLPVHEEVDPKLYRMEDFEKGKEEKPSPTSQETKEPPTPPVKEQKGVFSFFGKVADKFEKGIDKLTKKSKKDGEKDSDEKSSSKSSSPKEPKKTLLEEVDVEKMFPKVGKLIEKPETFEEAKPTIADVKVAAIRETAAFIEQEILDTKKQNIPDIEEKLSTDNLEEIKKAEAHVEPAFVKDASAIIVSPIKSLKDQEIAKEIEILKEEEDAEEVKALLEEASKKFKTVKDSLRDSLESLDEKIKEEEIAAKTHEIQPDLKDAVKDTLDGVVEKLEEIKPHTEIVDIKEPEKVKFDIPKDEEFEEEYEEPVGPFRDMKEAVRDVGEVLAGTAGIEIEDKSKNVIEIVKKVAEVLKEDDFLFNKALFDESVKKEEISPVSMDRKPSKEEISPIPTERKPSLGEKESFQEKITKLEEEGPAREDIVIPKKVGVTEEIPVHEEVEELIQESKLSKPLASYEKPGAIEVKEEPCVKVVKKKEVTVTSPAKDAAKDKKDAQKICEEMLKDDQHICVHDKPAVDDTSRVDVMQAGIEHVCVKEMAKRSSFEDRLSESEIEQPVISFEQKVLPANAEIVMVTPDSTPTSPKFSTDKMYEQELDVGLQQLQKLPEDVREIFSKEAPVEEIIEEFLTTKKKKITIEIIEYITVIKRIPRERVIYIIEEIIKKKGLPRENVVDDPEILKLEEFIMPEKKIEVEEYIVNEYVIKGKRITIQVIEEISIKKVVPKKIVVEIIEEIIIKRKIAKHMVLDIPEEVLSEIIKEESPKESTEEQIMPKIDITAKRESVTEVPSALAEEVKESIMPQKRAEIEEFIVNEYVIKGKKITESIIDEICAKKIVPKQILIEIIEEIIIKKKVPKSMVLEITEEEILAMTKETPEYEEQKEVPEAKVPDEKRKSVTEVPSAKTPEIKEPVSLQKKAEVEEYIINEYVIKGNSVTTQKLEEICGNKKVPKRIVIEIIEEIIIKRKMPRHLILSMTEEELSSIIKDEMASESHEKGKSVVEALSLGEEKKTPTEVLESKKEDTLEHEISEEELSTMSEAEDEDEEEKLVDGFVSVPRRISDGKVDAKKKEISSVKAEVSPVAAKEHEKDVIDDFEAVEQEYKVRDLPVTSPERADEMREKEDVESAAEDTASEVIEADEKFVQETKGKVGKEEPQFDTVTSIKYAKEKRELEEPETSEISETVDTIEKYLDEPKEKTDDILPKETIAKSVSPVLDKAEKSLIEQAGESKELKGEELPKDIVSDKRPSIDKTALSEVISKSTALSPKAIDEKLTTDKAKEIEPIKDIVEESDESKIMMKDVKSEETISVKDEILKDVKQRIEEIPKKVTEKMEPETKLADATGFAKEPKLLEDDKKLFEATEISVDDKVGEIPEDALRKKRSISKEPEEPVIKDEPHIEDVKPSEKVKEDEKLDKPSRIVDDGSVKRMLVTASSEDGRVETEICPTGTITFTKTVTPDDSFKDTSVKSTPDKDSLLMDKDSLHSGMSSPEKDSISEKSAPESKDKITPVDSLEKSPIDIRDSQALEDSLEKSESRKPKSPVKDAKEIERAKSPAEEIQDKTEKPKSPAEKIEEPKLSTEVVEDVLKSPIRDVAEKFEKPKSPIAETIFSKSSEPIKEIKSITDKELPISLEKEKTLSRESKDDQMPDNLEAKESSSKVISPVVVTSALDEKYLDTVSMEKSRSSSISSEKHEEKDASSTTSEKSEDKESSVRSKSPSIAGDKPEHVDLLAQSEDKSRSSSVASIKTEELKLVEPEVTEKSRSSSITTDAQDKRPSTVEKETIGLLDKSRSPSIVSDKEEKEDTINKSRSSSIVSEPIDKEMSEQRKSSVITIDKVEEIKPIEKSRSPSISEEKEPVDRSKSPSIISEKSEQDIKSLDKSPSILSDKVEEKEIDKPKSPSAIEKETISEKSPILESEHYDEKGPIDEAKSPSAISDKFDEKKESDHSKSPSIVADKPGLEDVERYLEKPKSPIFDRPESPKDIDKTEETQDKDRFPSIASDKSDSKEISNRSGSSSICIEKVDLKDIDLPTEKARSPDQSRSSTVTNIINESKESLFKEQLVTVDKTEEFLDKSKSPSPIDQMVDIEDKRLAIAEHLLARTEHLVEEIRKSPGSEEKLEDLTQEPIEKLRSPSISSHVVDNKELIDRSKSPSIADEKSDLKDVTEQPLDKSRSSSIGSAIDVQIKTADLSKSPSIAEKEKSDKKEIIEPLTEKSKSPSVITTEQKEPIDLSKSPKSPTISGKKEEFDRSKSPSMASDKSEDAKSAIGSKRSSLAGDMADLKDVSVCPYDRSKSPSIMSERSDGKKSADDSRATSVTEEKPDLKDVIELTADKSRSPSVVSEKAEPTGKPISPIASDKLEPPVDRSKSPSIASDKSDEKTLASSKEHYEDAIDKSPSFVDMKIPDKKDIEGKSLTGSEKCDMKTVDDLSQVHDKSPSIILDKSMDQRQIEKADIDETPITSDLDVIDKTRSLSIISDKTEPKSPSDASKSPSLADEKSDQKDKSRSSSIASERLDDIDTKIWQSEGKGERPISPSSRVGKISKDESIKSSQASSPVDKTPIDKSCSQSVLKLEESDEDIVKIKVTAEKKAEIEKYVLEEFISKKKKISLMVIERLVMTFSVPQFTVMEIIEDIISRQKMSRSSVFDFDVEEVKPQYEIESELEALTPQKEAEIETYIVDEFIAKKKKITSEMLEEMVILKAIPRNIIIMIIEEIIIKRQIPRNTVIESDLGESKEENRYDRDTKALSASPSLSSEPIPSDKSTQDSPARSEPHIDEEISISEEKRAEIERLLEEEYIKKDKKITEVILEEIMIRTSLPKYIILEIVEEIILKRKLPRESVIDIEIYQEEEPEEDYEKAMYHFDRTGTDYEGDVRKSSGEYKMDMYPESDERQLDKSDYPMDYESQFHKTFVGGMTEMRTTHITTLSGKSTPEFTHDATPESRVKDKSDKLPERTLTTTHITKTDVEDSKPMQTVTLLRESKIAESYATTESPEKHDDAEVVKTMKREVIEQEEPETITKVGKHEIGESSEVVSDKPEGDVKEIIKREVVEGKEEESGIVSKEIMREIETDDHATESQDDIVVVKKIVKHEVTDPDVETKDFEGDADEFVETITTKTTRKIVTEELSDAELSQIDPSKIYTDPTSGTTYKVISEESVPDTTADVKRIVTTVTTITGPDGKVITKKDVKESNDTVDSEDLLEKLIDSSSGDTGKITTETKSAEKIVKETITTVTSDVTSTPDVKAFYDSGKSTPDLKQEDKFESMAKKHLGSDKFEHPVSPLIRDLISDDKSYSGKSSPDISLPKDIVCGGSTDKSTPEIPMSPLIRDGAVVQPHLSGRSTPDRRSEGRSSTATPEGFRSGEMFRTTITTTKTISDEGEIVTTTREVTETTNEKGETIVLAEKTDVKVDERLPSKDAAESAISNIIGNIKTSELQRSDSPGSDGAASDKDRGPSSPPSDHSSVRSKAMTHVWGSSEERHTYSDDEPPSSPLSSTSQVGYSPQATRRHDSTSDKEEEQKQSIEFSAAAMSSSFYGELPAVPPQISAMKTFHGETGMQKSSEPIPTHSRFMVEREFAGGYGEKPDAKKYVDEADLDFDKALMEHKEMKEVSGAFSSGIAPRYTNGNLRHETEDSRDYPSSTFRDDTKDDSKGDSKKDPLEGWGTPLGLPSPKPPRKFNLKNPTQPSCSSASASDNLNFDVVKDWGEPLRLPSPAPVTNEVSNKGAPSTPKKERKQTKKVQSENIKNKKRSESPGKNEKKMKDSKNKIQPVYMDLAYVPHHGNSYYTSLEFFKRVRARYYVFSGTEPSREVYDALLEAKKTWEDKDLGEFIVFAKFAIFYID